MRAVLSDSTKNPERVEFANILRGVAALLVVLSHYVVLFWSGRQVVSAYSGLPALSEDHTTPQWVSWIIDASYVVNPGALGVGLFFIISGFVIPFSFDKQDYKQFAISRFFRIWPTYFIGFLLTVSSIFLATQLSGRDLPFPISAIFPHLIIGLRGLLQSQSIDGIVWTLEVETGFYLLAALISSSIRRASLFTFIVPVALLILAVGTKYVAISFGHDTVPRALTKALSFSPYLIFMFIGVALHFRLKRRLLRSGTAVLVAFLLAACASATVFTTNNLRDVGPSYLFSLCLFLLAMSAPKFRARSIILGFLSDISYPLYVVHPVIGYICLSTLIERYNWPAAASTVFAIMIAILLAWLLHITVEQPTRSIGRYLSSPRIQGRTETTHSAIKVG